MNDDQRVVLEQWRNGLQLSHAAHSRAAAQFRTRARWLGLGAVILSSVVGTGIFASVERSPSTAVKIVAGLLIVLVAVLTGAQTFLGYPRLVEAHGKLAADYGKLRRDLDELLVAPGDDQAAFAAELKRVRGRWDELDADAIPVPDAWYRRTVASVAKTRQAIGAKKASDSQ